MFCHNCGTKLPEGAKFCINCGAKVLASMAETNTNLSVSQDNEMSMEEVRDKYFAIRAPFEQNAILQVFRAGNQYRESVHGIDDFLGNFIPDMKKYWVDAVQLGVKTLLDHGIDYIDEKKIAAHIESCIESEPGVQDINQQCAALQQFGQQLAEETGDKTYWRGGGFGVSGAISGAVKAELMNVGTNALISFGRFITGNSASAKMRRFKEKLFNEHDNFQNTISIIKNMNHSVFLYAYDILVREGQMPQMEFEEEKAQGKFNNLLQQLQNGTREYTLDEKKAIITKCMELDPYNMQFYVALYSADVAEFDDLWERTSKTGLLVEFLLAIRQIDSSRLEEQRKKLAEHTDNQAILENVEWIAFDDDELNEIFRRVEHHYRSNVFTKEHMDGLVLFPHEEKISYLLDNSEDETEETSEDIDKELAHLAEYTPDDSRYTDRALSRCLNDEHQFKILLVNDMFAIPLNRENVTYIGVDDASAWIDSEEWIDWGKKKVNFINLPFDGNYQNVIDEHFSEKLNQGKTSLSQHDFESAFSAFQISALVNKNPEGMYQLGLCYLNGIGTERCPERAMKCFSGAAKNGIADAALILARSYASGSNGMLRNSQKAVEYYRAAIRGGIDTVEPYFYVGMVLFQLANSRYEFSQAGDYLKKAADRGNMDAALIVAGWYEGTVFGAPDAQASRQYYDLAYSAAINFGHNGRIGQTAIDAVFEGAESVSRWGQAFGSDDPNRQTILKWLLDDLNTYYTQHQFRPPTPEFFQPEEEMSKEAAIANYQQEMQQCVSSMQNWINVNSTPWKICLTPLKIIYWLTYGLLQPDWEGKRILGGNEYGRLLVDLQQMIQRLNFPELIAYLQNNAQVFKGIGPFSDQYQVGDGALLRNFRAMRHVKMDAFAQEFAGIIYNFVSLLQNALSREIAQ